MHTWNLTETAALELQEQLANKIVLATLEKPVDYVAGVDVAYAKSTDTVVAAAVVFDAVNLEVIDKSTAIQKTNFPYIPGLFSFRELPSVLEALSLLTTQPQLIVCDGHGIAHPRRFGLANHLGLLTNIPSIGCAKTPLLTATSEVETARGQIAILQLNGEIVGNVLRTQTGVKPVYVSPGHKITLPESIDWILKLSPKFRLPKTTRQADQLVKKALSEINK